MEKYIYDENPVSAILCKAIIICPTLPYPLRNNSLSVYGNSDTHDI